MCEWVVEEKVVCKAYPFVTLSARPLELGWVLISADRYVKTTDTPRELILESGLIEELGLKGTEYNSYYQEKISLEEIDYTIVMRQYWTGEKRENTIIKKFDLIEYQAALQMDDMIAKEAIEVESGAGVCTKQCIYRGKVYRNAWVMENSKVCILSRHEQRWDTVAEYKNKGEKKHVYAKTVDMDELDDFYIQRYIVVYKGYFFSPINLEKRLLKTDSLFILTSDAEVCKELGENPQWNHERVVSLKEIEYLILEKTYLTGEKKGKTEKENMDIVKYLSNLPGAYEEPTVIQTQDGGEINQEVVSSMRTAIEKGELSTVRKLIEANEGLLGMDTRFGSWLHIAVEHEKIDIVKYLIDCGIDVNKKGGAEGRSPMRIAAEKSYLDIVKELFRNGAKLDVSEKDNNPLFGAMEYPVSFDVVKFLVEQGIDISAKYHTVQYGYVNAYEYARQHWDRTIKTTIADYLQEKLDNNLNTI